MHIIGVDIGGTKCAILLGKAEPKKDLKIIDKIKFPTQTEKGLRYMTDLLLKSTKDIIQKNGLKNTEIACIGINCGGPVSSKEGLILSPPNLIGWDRVPIVEIFEQELGIHAKLQNDANAGALAEWMYGGGKGYENLMFITFGTGFGAGLILNNQLYSGTNDMAGEIGHIRIAEHGPVGFGKEGSLEGFCSGGGITQLAKTKVLEQLQMGKSVSFCPTIADLDGINAKVVGDAADEGDELAKEIYRISGYYLGKGLSIFMDLLNPQIILIGSIFSKSTHLLWPYAKQVIEKEALSHTQNVCQVKPAGLGDKIGDYEALSIGVYEMEGLK